MIVELLEDKGPFFHKKRKLFLCDLELCCPYTIFQQAAGGRLRQYTDTEILKAHGSKRLLCVFHML